MGGPRTRYLEWLLPGILAMSMMFSSLYGVGYVIVRYRKNGALRRLKATPLTAMEYLGAQMLSRICVLMFCVTVLWVGCETVFSLRVAGSRLVLLLIYFMGGSSLVTLGVIIASRGVSEEFTEGMVNFISWPMMFLSEVWFSLEGAPDWVRTFAKIFPLTHILSAARKVMCDGAGLVDVHVELLTLAGMTALFLIIAASLFSWSK